MTAKKRARRIKTLLDTPLELKLFRFCEARDKWWDELLAAQAREFPDADGAPWSSPERKREFNEWEKQYKKDNKRPETPREIALDLDPGDLPSRLVSHYFSSDKIVIFREKHGDRHFLLPAGDQEAHGRVALRVIRERHRDGFYYGKYEVAPEAPRQPQLSKERASALPNKYREMAAEEWSEYERETKRYKQEAMLHGLFQKALEGDPLAAVAFLRINREKEYEGYEVVVPEKC